MQDKPIPGIESCDIVVYRRTESFRQSVPIIREVAVRVALNGKELATIACSGCNMGELAAGFLRSEGFIGSAADIAGMNVSEEQGLVQVLTKDGLNRDEHGRDAPDVIASSGARGWKHDQPVRYRSNLSANRTLVSVKQVLGLMERFVERSGLHKDTGGTHSAALADGDHILVVMEDIGRHNTVDMLSGYALLNGIDCSDKIILRTGRVSAEIVHKVWGMGVPVMASLSVPTSVAVRLCNEAGITLIGAVRNEKMHVYSQGWRITK